MNRREGAWGPMGERCSQANSIAASNYSLDVSGLELPIVDCDSCNIPVMKLLSTSKKNPNRFFYKCKNKDNPYFPCNFYMWEDEYYNHLVQQGIIGRGKVMERPRMSVNAEEFTERDKLTEVLAELKIQNCKMIEILCDLKSKSTEVMWCLNKLFMLGVAFVVIISVGFFVVIGK